MAVVLEVTRPVRAAVLREAFAAVAGWHDMLRARFHAADGGWAQEIAREGGEIPVEEIDLGGLGEAEEEAAVARVAARLQAGLHLGDGPVVRAALLGRGAGRGQRLLVAAHHMVIDGVSWRVILEDLQSACERLAGGELPAFPLKTTSYPGWAERLAAYAASDAPRAELPYWLRPAHAAVGPIPRDFPRGANREDAGRVHVVEFSAAETVELLEALPAARGVRVNDVLLAALLHALGRWTGSDAVLVDLEGHGREELFGDVELARTVGCFTALFPVVLEASGHTDPAALLAPVREQLAAVPGHGVGYGVLRWLAGGDAAASLAALPRAEVSFNYLGRFGGDTGSTPLFVPTTGHAGPVRGAANHRTHLLEVLGMTVDGRLRLHWSFSARVHRPETIARVAGDFAAALRALTGAAPAEAFALAGLDAGTIAGLEAELDLL
jgi:non-ribosomal peptide synthase protein (TIGR01720 family)